MAVLAGCGFEHGIAGTGGGSDPIDDAAPVVVDGSPQVSTDARPSDGPCGDDDQDGLCNAMDDWPCGVKPQAPGATMTMSGNNGDTSVAITQVQLDGTGRLAVAMASETLQLAFHYDIDDDACPQACIDQIEIGWEPGARYGCPFDDPVSPQNGANGNIGITIPAPATPGVYDLRANIGQNRSCTFNGANNWWNATPVAARTIAKLCVH
jgi:hypothetical protein